jgi:hypothetical protein
VIKRNSAKDNRGSSLRKSVFKCENGQARLKGGLLGRGRGLRGCRRVGALGRGQGGGERR